jgi:hypothetical protein
LVERINRGDGGRGRDRVGITESIQVKDFARWRSRWTLVDFLDPDGTVEAAGKAGVSLIELQRRFRDRIVKHQTFVGNLLLNEGINLLWTLGCGGSGTAWNNANSYTGVGDSNTAAAATQTGLQASTNKQYKAVDSGYPTYGSSQQAVWQTTFGTGDANFSWQEITVANGSSDSATNLNRKVQDMGTKTSAVTRVATLTVTLS